MTVEEVLHFVEKKALGKRAATALKSPPTPSANAMDEGADREEAVSSSYRRQQRPKPSHTPKATPKRPIATPHRPLATPPANTDKGACSFCGRQGHGTSARTAIRRVQCPAYGKICQTCGRPNHYAQQCWQTMELENTVEETVHDMSEGTLPHHTWSPNSRKWTQKKSPPQPTLTVSVATKKADYSVHGHTLRVEGSSPSTTALADTGCQSCLAGTQLIKDLHLERRDLIPSTLTMRSASGNQIPIWGAVLARITTAGKETRQMLYISPVANKLYLSLSSCTDLGLIQGGFPGSQMAASIRSNPSPHPEAGAPTGEQAAKVAKCRPATPIANTTKSCSCPTRSQPPTRPASPPFPATEANREKLEEYLLNLYSSSSFNTCEHQPLPMMTGPPLALSIDPNAIPKPCHNPIPVPVHWQEEVKRGLDRDVSLGVLEKVPLGTPVTWCHRVVICTKKNGSLRRTIDFQPLNIHATRETHHFPSPFHQARAIPRDTKKTIFDAWNGYHSVPLRKEDRHFTTFITPWGRYRYMTAPQGYIASGDAYTSRYDALAAHIGQKTKCVDDALLWSDNIEEAFHQATEWLDMCARNGITLNPTKFRFALDVVDFAGFTVTPSEVRPADHFTNAIKEFPTPANITDVRAWFGLVNQVSYSFTMTDAMLPFRDLLKPSSPFLWTNELTKALDASKSHICRAIKQGVQIFDKGRPTCLSTDWSKSGVGYWLTQKHCNCQSSDPFCCREGWKVTLVGSRFTHSAESRYAPVEGEALAVAEALDRARHFVLGCSDLMVAVDHKPLLKLFSDRCLEDIPNPRLRNLKERTLRYRFRMVYVPGTRNLASDALSRHPSGTKTPPRLHLQDDILGPDPSCPHEHHTTANEIQTNHQSEEGGLQTALCSALSSSTIGWEELQTATTEDPTLQDLMMAIEEGPPSSKDDLPQCIQAYYKIWDSLSTVDDVVCYGSRLVIPQQLRSQCLRALHSAHQGVSGMTARAVSTIYWPGITADIQSTRDQCPECSGIAPSQPALPPTTPAEPNHPFSDICADYFHHAGSHYLVVVDRLSGWPIVAPAARGAAGLASVLRETFASYGIPESITTDGGPEFTAHSTKQLLASWGVHHRLCSAYHPHSNNRAETAVKSMKRLIAGNTGPGGTLTSPFFKALLTYRNTPAPDTKTSPAMIVLGRPIRDMLPTLPSKLQIPVDKQWRKAMDKRKSEAHHRWSAHSNGLTPLKCGEAVYIQNQRGNHPGKWDSTGTITEVLQYHQYSVRMDGNGRLTTRNRRHLRRNGNPRPSPEASLKARLEAAPPMHPRPATRAQSPLPPTPEPTPRPTAVEAQPTPTALTPTRPQATPPLVPPVSTPIAPPPVHSQAPRKLQSPPTNNLAGPQSYAAVAGSPPTFHQPPPKPPTSPKPSLENRPTKVTAQPQPTRRSNRIKKPVDRYGQ